MNVFTWSLALQTNLCSDVLIHDQNIILTVAQNKTFIRSLRVGRKKKKSRLEIISTVKEKPNDGNYRLEKTRARFCDKQTNRTLKLFFFSY